MRTEMCCNCSNQTDTPPGDFTDDLLEKLNREGPWDGLGDGQTFEDILYQRLAECPACGRAVAIKEEELCRMSMAMLTQL